MLERPFLPPPEDTLILDNAADGHKLLHHAYSVGAVLEKYDTFVDKTKQMSLRRDHLVRVDNELTTLELSVLEAIKKSLGSARTLDRSAIQQLIGSDTGYIEEFTIEHYSTHEYQHLSRELAIRLGAVAAGIKIHEPIVVALQEHFAVSEPIEAETFDPSLMGAQLRQLQAERDVRYPQDWATLPLNIFTSENLTMKLRKPIGEPLTLSAHPLRVGLATPLLSLERPPESQA